MLTYAYTQLTYFTEDILSKTFHIDLSLVKKILNKVM
jgi:hypothetical protein